MPVGFSGRGNIVMPFTSIWGATSTSSFATSSLSGTLGNHLSILMSNHPGTTLEGANTIMQQNYLLEDTFKYKDPEDGVIKDGGTWYFFNTEKFLKEEVLHRAEVEAALDGSPQSLPSMGGLYYEGKGIQFSCGGQTYDMIEDNRSVLENAVKSGQEIQWTYSPDRARKFGVSGNNTVTVRVMDKQARFIPDISMSVQVK